MIVTGRKNKAIAIAMSVVLAIGMIPSAAFAVVKAGESEELADASAAVYTQSAAKEAKAIKKFIKAVKKLPAASKVKLNQSTARL